MGRRARIQTHRLKVRRACSEKLAARSVSQTSAACYQRYRWNIQRSAITPSKLRRKRARLVLVNRCRGTDYLPDRLRMRACSVGRAMNCSVRPLPSLFQQADEAEGHQRTLPFHFTQTIQI